MLYRLAAVTLLAVLVVSCSEGGFTAFENPTTATTSTTSGSGGSGGDGGPDGTGTGTGTSTTTDFSNIALKSHIPMEVPDGTGGTLTAVFQRYSMGNSDASISYVLSTSDDVDRLITPTAGGPVEIYSRPGEIVRVTTSGDGNTILNYNGRSDIIDYATGTTRAIGAALTLERPSSITDAGDVVAFDSRKDLTGDNPSLVNQLFTLSTDGSETYNQITTFNIHYALENVMISGDGTRIFFTSQGDVIGDGSNVDASHELFAINTDGTGLVQLTDFDSLIWPTHISTDGNVVSMTIRSLGGVPGEYLSTLNIAASTFTVITVVPTGNIIHHDLSADGSKVAYIGENDFGTPTIYLVNSDGTSEVAPLSHAGTMEYVNINTNGSQITFYSNIDFGKAVAPDDAARQIYTLTVQ